jgi:hypothetical protein
MILFQTGALHGNVQGASDCRPKQRNRKRKQPLRQPSAATSPYTGEASFIQPGKSASFFICSQKSYFDNNYNFKIVILEENYYSASPV